MDIKKFKQRFIEFLADTNCYGLGPADMKTYRRRKKEITERRRREDAEEAYLLEHWFKQDAYVNGTPFKRLLLCIQYALRNIRGEKYLPTIPAHLRKEMARCLLPDIIAFCESEKGKAEIAQWKAEQEAKKEQSKAS